MTDCVDGGTLKGKLLALAERCERVNALDAERDELGVEINEALGIASYITDDGDPTQSVDAAITLIPAGYGWNLQGNGALFYGVVAGSFGGPSQTPALALTAAALRARAAAL